MEVPGGGTGTPQATLARDTDRELLLKWHPPGQNVWWCEIEDLQCCSLMSELTGTSVLVPASLQNVSQKKTG